MRLHTNLTYAQVYGALHAAQRKRGKITADVSFVDLDDIYGSPKEFKSATHPRAFEVQLGTYDQHSLPAGTKDQHGKKMNVRRFKNSGTRGATSENTGESPHALGLQGLGRAGRRELMSCLAGTWMTSYRALHKWSTSASIVQR